MSEWDGEKDEYKNYHVKLVGSVNKPRMGKYANEGKKTRPFQYGTVRDVREWSMSTPTINENCQQKERREKKTTMRMKESLQKQ